MSNIITNQKLILFILFYLNACDGVGIFRNKPCEEGTVRKGSVCVAEDEESSGDCKDPDLSGVQKGVTLTLCDGSVGEGKLVVPSDCTKDGEQNCIVKNNFKVARANSISSDEIKNGKTIAGITGSLRNQKFCRNYSDLTTFDSSYPPSNIGWNNGLFNFDAPDVATATDQITFVNRHGLVTNSPVRFTTTSSLPAPLVVGTTYYAIYVDEWIIRVASVPNGAQINITSTGFGDQTAHDVPNGLAQYFDTIDDFNNSKVYSPANNPWSNNEYLCDSSNFVNVTGSSAPLLPNSVIPSTGNQPFTQIWQDQISGRYLSNILADAGGLSWSHAVRTCESLNGGTAGDGWRLPTQKELLHFYVHGISKVPLAGGSTNASFWSSTGVSTVTGNAWDVNLSSGGTASSNRFYNTNSVLCTR